MKLRTILTLGLAALLMTACQKDEGIDYDPMQGLSHPILIDGRIDQQYLTRVDDGGFCEGDQVGLYGVNYTNDNTQAGTLLDEGNQVDNARYTYDEANLKWTASGNIYYKDAETNIDLYAYYPYGNPASTSAYQFEVQQDQSGAGVTDGYGLSDFLWAKAENVVPSEAKVKLRFSHRLACAHVVLVEGAGFAAGEFDALSKSVLAMNTTRTAEVDLATGVATATGEAPSEGIVMKQNSEGFRAIVVPQTVAAMKPLFAITVDGIAYRFKKDAAFTYEAGKQSKFTIEVSKKAHSGQYEFTLTDTEIVDWVADLDTHGGEARQYYVVHQEEAGMLGQLLREAKKNPNKIKNLKVSGKINTADFYFMRDQMEILQSINLKEAEIVQPAHEIPEYAFNGKTSLVNFVFPEKVTKIGGSAFYGTTLSGALLIPDDVTSIGGNAFYGTNISSLQLPPNLREIGAGAFNGCSSVSGSLTLPETLESIGPEAFYICSMLSGTLTLPSKLTMIDVRTFEACGFTGDLVIPENIKSIGTNAFCDCDFDGYLTLSNSLTKIDYKAFSSCKFQGELFIPKELKSIGNQAFNSNSFTNVVFEEGSELKKIGNDAFGGNARLSEPIVLPEGLTTIGSGAFAGCKMLPSVVIPSTVTAIGAYTFQNCYYITKLQCDATMPPICGSDVFYGVGKENLTLEVPEESVSLYQTATGWSDFNRISAHYDFSIARKHIRTLNAAYSKNYLLRVPSGEAWKVESCPEWVTVTPASGVGRTEVTVTVSEMPRTSDTFTFEEMDDYGNWTTETHKGRVGEIIFLLESKDRRVKMDVQQYDSDNYDGQVIPNQTSTKGGGVNIVFMGDCFDARDIANGSYLNGINEAIGYYFAIEPYKSYKEYFNVYTVVGMSTDSGMGTVNLVKEAKFGSQYSLDGIAPDTEATYEYAMKAPTVDEGNLNETLVVMVENTEDYGGICYMWADGSAIAICPMSRDAYPFDFRGIVQHEAGGHGFAKLGDEYIYYNSWIQTCQCYEPYLQGKAYGWYRNLSTNGDHHTVEWAHLFAHPDYTNVVDMYEGGYTHTRGIYRSEANSCMNNNVPYYSAIQRQEMVERIKRYAGEEFRIEEFYANDVRDASNNDFVTRSLVEKASAGHAASAQKQMPPKFMGDSPLRR